jgi:hypothetical protein
MVYAFPLNLAEPLPAGALIKPPAPSTAPLPANLEFTSGNLLLREGKTRRSQPLTLIYRTNGNLTLVESATGRTLWQTGTGTQDCAVGCVAHFQPDGNLVLYQGSTTIW